MWLSILVSETMFSENKAVTNDHVMKANNIDHRLNKILVEKISSFKL